jgi:hypothetical protein
MLLAYIFWLDMGHRLFYDNSIWHSFNMTKIPKPNSVVCIPGVYGEYEVQYTEGFVKVFFDNKEIYNSKNDVELLVQQKENV